MIELEHKRQFGRSLRLVFKKLRREKVRPEDKPPPPPGLSFFPTKKLPTFFGLGNASIMVKTNFMLGPMSKSFYVVLL